MSQDPQQAVKAVCAAMNAHLEACANGEPVPVVIALGEELAGAVLEYERALGDAYGWSNPIRHLGPPADHDSQIGAQASQYGRSGLAARAVITINQQVEILDAGDFAAAVQQRFGDIEATDLPSAIQKVAEAEAWQPSQSESMRTLATSVEVLLEDFETVDDSSASEHR